MAAPAGAASVSGVTAQAMGFGRRLRSCRIVVTNDTGGMHLANAPYRRVDLAHLADRSSAMKPGIHPEYHEINVIMTDGTQFKTRSCYGKAGDTLRLDIDPKSHPAWTGQHRIIDSGGQVAKFNKKFAGIGLKKG